MNAEDLTGLSEMNSKQMPYVSFVTMPKEDKKQSERLQRYVAKDVDYARITAPGTRDLQIEELPRWWDKLYQQVQAGRMPQAWVDKWKAAHAKWKQGQDLPPDGTPIKGWGVISPAQQDTLIRANVLTVEDLAQATSEAIAHVGMGAVQLKRKAEAWLKQMGDKGPLTMEVAKVKQENDLLKKNLETMQEKMDELKARLEQAEGLKPKGRSRKEEEAIV